MQRDRFLYLTTFVCGAAVMGVEIAAARYLAPYFGQSIITWTILIGVIMTSLSIGNIIGGNIADSPPARDTMYRLIWIAAMWIALAPFFGKYLIAASSLMLMWAFPGSVMESGILFSTCALFAVPCMILGTVTPCLIRLGIKDLEHSGRLAGELYALSTVGSILGTILPTFLTIPRMGTTRTFLAFAGILGGLSLVHFLRRKTGVRAHVLSLGLTACLLVMPYSNSYAFWKETVFEGESSYNYLQITREKDETVLSTHVEIGRQSVLRKGSRFSGTYYDFALAAPFFRPGFRDQDPLEILVIGFGAGSYAKLCRSHFPNSRVDGVEIDPRIASLGTEYFDLEPGDADLFTEDGRAFLVRFPEKRYDVIFLDAFQDVSIPFHLATREFFHLAAGRLNPGGCLVINVNLHFKGNTLMIEALAQTAREAFPGVWCSGIPGLLNAVIFASRDPLAAQALSSNADGIPADHILRPILFNLKDNLESMQKAEKVFSDDRSDIELVSHRIVGDLVERNLRSLLACLAITLAKKGF